MVGVGGLLTVQDPIAYVLLSYWFERRSRNPTPQAHEGSEVRKSVVELHALQTYIPPQGNQEGRFKAVASWAACTPLGFRGLKFDRVWGSTALRVKGLPRVSGWSWEFRGRGGRHKLGPFKRTGRGQRKAFGKGSLPKTTSFSFIIGFKVYTGFKPKPRVQQLLRTGRARRSLCKKGF